ncbi:MAG: hypothetical protein H8D74_01145 [Chloroflexi bacterium]|nr:hypothetical protein [Chloroflexota bacterium]
MIEIDPATLAWREMFAKAMAAEFDHHRQLLVEIRDQGRVRNGRVRANEIAIAGLKTWVAVIGSGLGLVGLASALLQALK